MSESVATNERILLAAEQLFLQYGIRSITMDDIAKDLAISKKTIYQHFKDKDEIVLKVSERVFAKEKEIMIQMHEQGENVIHEMVLISECIRERVSSVNPSAMHDLQKFYKEGWGVFLAFQQDSLQLLIDILNKGISQGYFRPDINARILAIFRSESISLSFDQHLFARHEFDPREVQTQLFEQFINGILTNKGRNLYQKYSEKSVSL